MSWFKHSPPKHPPHRAHTAPYRTSPAAEKMLDEAKKTGPKERKLSSDSGKSKKFK
jgi:hypothetical protein